MARRDIPEPDGRDIAKAIEKNLPGWTLASNDANVADVRRVEISGAEPGATLGDLRKKFLGGSRASDSDSFGGEPSLADNDFGKLDKTRLTIRVRPRSGGPSKVADLGREGPEIVQG